jgi:hypothetical protein
MTTEHQATQQEKAYNQFGEEIWEELSEPARTLIGEAQSAAYAAHMVCNYCFQWDIEYDEAWEKMRLAAAKLTEREHKLLAKLWRVALAAAASIDPDDYETLVGDRVYRGDLHSYYRMFSSMVEGTLWEKIIAEDRKKIAESKPEDPEYIPF